MYIWHTYIYMYIYLCIYLYTNILVGCTGRPKWDEAKSAKVYWEVASVKGEKRKQGWAEGPADHNADLPVTPPSPWEVPEQRLPGRGVLRWMEMASLLFYALAEPSIEATSRRVWPWLKSWRRLEGVNSWRLSAHCTILAVGPWVLS